MTKKAKKTKKVLKSMRRQKAINRFSFVLRNNTDNSPTLTSDTDSFGSGDTSSVIIVETLAASSSATESIALLRKIARDWQQNSFMRKNVVFHSRHT